MEDFSASAYKNNAISRANGILSNYRKLLKKGKNVRIPYCFRPMLTTCKGFVLRLEGNELILPSKLRIKLNDYVLKRIEGAEIRSVTLSKQAVSICFMRKKRKIECTGFIGIDTNLENVTIADPFAQIKKYDMTDIVAMKTKYREIKQHLQRNDFRIRKSVYGKYGKLETDKTQAELHKITSRIVRRAKIQKLGIALERIKGIRKLYHKWNGQGNEYRFKLNTWTFRAFQTQIEYKAKREGLQVMYVNARGTSAKCSICDDKMFVKEGRMLYCARCKRIIDRDQNAAINVMKRGSEKLFSTRFEPIGLPDEAMKRNPVKKLTAEVILKADGSQEN